MRRVAAFALLLAGCGEGAGPATPPPTASAVAVPLEQAAIAAGLVPDPGADPTGVYAREGDRVCVVPAATGWRIGAVTEIDRANRCAAAGTLARDGARLALDFGAGCAFDARFEGDRIVFPAELPRDCARACTGRASLSALDVPMLSDAPAEARVMSDPRGRRLCGDAP